MALTMTITAHSVSALRCQASQGGARATAGKAAHVVGPRSGSKVGSAVRLCKTHHAPLSAATALPAILSASAALADEAVAAAAGGDIGRYVASAAPLILYGIYRVFLADDRTSTASHILVRTRR